MALKLSFNEKCEELVKIKDSLIHVESIHSTNELLSAGEFVRLLDEKSRDIEKLHQELTIANEKNKVLDIEFKEKITGFEAKVEEMLNKEKDLNAINEENIQKLSTLLEKNKILENDIQDRENQIQHSKNIIRLSV